MGRHTAPWVRTAAVGAFGVGTIEGFAATAYPSPDGARLAIAAHLDSTTMCWDFTDVAFRAIDVAPVRRHLGAAP